MKTLFALLFVSASALADDGAALRCRQIAEPTARLSCYDALPLVAPTPMRPASAMAAAVPTPPASALGEQAVARQALEKSFGMEFNKKATLDEIESTIAGRFEGWRPRQRITLANGQVWMVNDDSDGTVERNDPKVIVRRGMLGAIYMDIDGARTLIRVRRVE